jgi:hypothetical protein
MSIEVFISYSRTDLPFVEKLNSFLRGLGVNTWFDKERLTPGMRWEDVVEDIIPSAKTFLTCLSKTAVSKRGYFQVEQKLSSEAALRAPSDELFIIPIMLGECDIPRELRQYHVANFIEPGAIDMSLVSLSSALGREIKGTADSIDRLHDDLLEHLGTERLIVQKFVNLFLKSDTVSFQDSMGIIQNIANLSDDNRLGILLKLRTQVFISYAEQAALEKAIENVRSGLRTENLQVIIANDEKQRIMRMEIPNNAEATGLLQVNCYFRYVSRKNTEAYHVAEAKIINLLAGID